jgi:hypothetical protein
VGLDLIRHYADRSQRHSRESYSFEQFIDCDSIVKKACHSSEYRGGFEGSPIIKRLKLRLTLRDTCRKEGHPALKIFVGSTLRPTMKKPGSNPELRLQGRPGVRTLASRRGSRSRSTRRSIRTWSEKWRLGPEIRWSISRGL